jgi:hypothetical protein
MTTYTFKTKKEALAKHEELWLNESDSNWDIFKNSKTNAFHVVKR